MHNLQDSTRDDLYKLAVEGKLPSTLRFCKKCIEPKPSRAHHCSVCNACVLRMDHHCPWIHNCVGWGNHRYFILFLGWLSTACVYYSINSIPYALAWRKKQILETGPHDVLFLFTLLLASVIGSAVFGLFAWHVYLVATGQNTIEYYSNEVWDVNSLIKLVQQKSSIL